MCEGKPFSYTNIHTSFFSPHNVLHSPPLETIKNKQKQTNKQNPSWNICSATQISRIWTPPIPSAYSSHPSLWNQTWVTAVEHLWTFCCVVIALQKSILWYNRSTTVNWRGKVNPLRHWMMNNVQHKHTDNMYCLICNPSKLRLH